MRRRFRSRVGFLLWTAACLAVGLIAGAVIAYRTCAIPLPVTVPGAFL